MLHNDYNNNSTKFTLQERLQQVTTCSMVRGIVVVNIGIVFLIPILDMILVNMSHNIGFLSLIFIGLCVYVFVITWMCGHWNEQKKRMQLSPIISMMIVALSVSCLIAFYQDFYEGIDGWEPYLLSMVFAVLVLLIALLIRILEYKYK